MVGQATMEDVQRTLGFALIGCFVNLCLLGVTMFQFFSYFHNWIRKDHYALSAFVGWVMVLNLLESVDLIKLVWDYCIQNFGGFEYASKANLPFIIIPSYIGVITLFVQGFLIFRLYVFTPYRLIVYPIVTIVLVAFIASILVSVRLDRISLFSRFSGARAVVLIWLGSSAAGDLLIALGLTHAFRKCRTGFSEDEKLLKIIIHRSLTTGALTAVSSIAAFCLFLKPEIGMSYLVPSWMTSKLFVISMMVVLLTRSEPSEGIIKRDHVQQEVQLSSIILETSSSQTGSISRSRSTHYSGESDLQSYATRGDTLSKGQKKLSFKDRILKQSFPLALNNMLRPNTDSVNISNETNYQVDTFNALERAHIKEDYQNLKRGKNGNTEGGSEITRTRFDSMSENVELEEEPVERIRSSHYSRNSSFFEPNPTPSSSITLRQSDESSRKEVWE